MSERVPQDLCLYAFLPLPKHFRLAWELIPAPVDQIRIDLPFHHRRYMTSSTIYYSISVYHLHRMSSKLRTHTFTLFFQWNTSALTHASHTPAYVPTSSRNNPGLSANGTTVSVTDSPGFPTTTPCSSEILHQSYLTLHSRLYWPVSTSPLHPTLPAQGYSNVHYHSNDHSSIPSPVQLQEALCTWEPAYTHSECEIAQSVVHPLQQADYRLCVSCHSVIPTTLASFQCTCCKLWSHSDCQAPDSLTLPPPPSQCFRCGTPPNRQCPICGERGPMKKCDQCLSIRYCSLYCQKVDWPRHRPECKRPPR